MVFDYEATCPECLKSGVTVKLHGDPSRQEPNKQIYCDNGHEFEDLPEENTVTEIFPETDAKNASESAESGNTPISSLGQTPEPVTPVQESAPITIEQETAVAVLETPQPQTPEPQVPAPLTLATWRRIAGGDALATVRIPELWASAIEARAEELGKTPEVYTSEVVAYIVEQGWLL